MLVTFEDLNGKFIVTLDIPTDQIIIFLTGTVTLMLNTMTCYNELKEANYIKLDQPEHWEGTYSPEVVELRYFIHKKARSFLSRYAYPEGTSMHIPCLITTNMEDFGCLSTGKGYEG